MAYLSKITDRNAVLEAMAECDALGEIAFLKRHGFSAAKTGFLRHAGNTYPARAIMGVAYGKQYPNEGTLDPSSFIGGKKAQLKRIVPLGFEYVQGRTNLAIMTVANLEPTGNEEVEATAQEIDASGYFDPTSVPDARKRVLQEIVHRRGQGKFRKELLEAYGSKCAISQCDCVETLEAAHIYPYLDGKTNHVTNGLLLRSDLHTLFDLGKLSIDEKNWTVLIAKEIMATAYGSLAGIGVYKPSNIDQRPNVEMLKWHRKKWKM